jgi:hypothetical protein
VSQQGAISKSAGVSGYRLPIDHVCEEGRGGPVGTCCAGASHADHDRFDGQPRPHPLLHELREHRWLLERLTSALNLPDDDQEVGCSRWLHEQSCAYGGAGAAAPIRAHEEGLQIRVTGRGNSQALAQVSGFEVVGGP